MWKDDRQACRSTLIIHTVKCQYNYENCGGTGIIGGLATKWALKQICYTTCDSEGTAWGNDLTWENKKVAKNTYAAELTHSTVFFFTDQHSGVQSFSVASFPGSCTASHRLQFEKGWKDRKLCGGLERG